MTRRSRRNHSPAFKAKVERLKNEETLVQPAELFDVHPNQFTQWKSQLLERAADLFASGQARPQEGPGLKELHAKIGQQGLEIDFYPARSAN